MHQKYLNYTENIGDYVTGGPIKADSLCTVMKRLRSRIIRLFETGTIVDDDGERQKLEYLVKTKKWYPYCICIRHSAIMLLYLQVQYIAEQLNK